MRGNSDAPVVVSSYFDSSYLARAVAMWESLADDQNVVFDFLCLDNASASEFYGKDRVKVTTQSDLLSQSPGLAEALVGRTKAERYFTMGPAHLVYVSQHNTNATWFAYVDADIFFYRSLSKHLATFDGGSAVLSPHRHLWHNRRRLSPFGRFNVGVVAFANSLEGKSLLSYWAEQCKSWCYDRVEEGKYADQKYLEDFDSLDEAVIVDESKGANVAPWNLGFSKVLVDSQKAPSIDGVPLVYVHFQGLKLYKNHWILGHLPFLTFATRNQMLNLYTPYLRKIEALETRALVVSGSSRPSIRLGIDLQKLQFLLGLILRQSIPVGGKGGKTSGSPERPK